MTSQQVRAAHAPAPGAGAAGPPPRSRRRRARLLRSLNARLGPGPRRRPFRAGGRMADVSERKLQLAVLLAFASGVLVGWQANRLRRRYLDWRKRRLQDQLAAAQKKLDLA
ncbi:mitoregulin-like [Myotis myotis]|nr:mitoregulin-like [Myotis myotis]